MEGYKSLGLNSGVKWGRSEDSGVVTVATEPCTALPSTWNKCEVWDVRCDAVRTTPAEVSRT